MDAPRLTLVTLAAACAFGLAPSTPAAGAADAPRPPRLRNASLCSPIPGGFLGGWAGDTGLDISASFRPVLAVAAGTLDYSERGHTVWVSGKDTPNSVRLRLDAPLAWRGRTITHVYYTHLSRLTHQKREGDDVVIHVDGCEPLGVSGIGNGVPHLHVGLLLDGNVEQDAWDTLLVEGEIRRVFGGYKNGERI